MTPNTDASHIGLKFGWVMFLALGIQVLAVGFINEISFDAARALLVASYVVLFPAVFMNIKRPGLGLVMVGLALNFIVIAANGGAMPIDPASLGASTDEVDALSSQSGFLPITKDVVRVGDDVNLRILSDIFPLPGPLRVAFSIGDVFILAGILMFAFAPLWPRKWSIRK
ncbi:MAG: DUF5317 domain-containing protein [SAR202 cluster bacterium]|nr:DUF5317 domain-containing protein [SAR202 cluster bacterium]